jgi:hypothetical protein
LPSGIPRQFAGADVGFGCTVVGLLDFFRGRRDLAGGRLHHLFSRHSFLGSGRLEILGIEI